MGAFAALSHGGGGRLPLSSMLKIAPARTPSRHVRGTHLAQGAAGDRLMAEGGAGRGSRRGAWLREEETDMEEPNMPEQRQCYGQKERKRACLFHVTLDTKIWNVRAPICTLMSKS